MRASRLPAVALVVSLLVVPLVVAGGEGSPDSAGCPDLTYRDGVGYVCPRGELIEVYAPDGRSLGFSHGPDPVCVDCVTDPEVLASGGTSPYCVAASPGEHYVHFIYARAYDDADRFGAMLPTLRTLIGQSNKMIDDAAIATGGRVDIKIKCADGVPVVENAVLPTPRGSASFSTVVDDLEGLGYANARAKYWIFYDDSSACACAGMGEYYADDRNVQDNYNNGAPAAAPMHAVSFGYADVRTLLHELGHTLGAVQTSAPHTTGAGHCIDGRDTMCYNDGGSRGGSYSTGYCSTEVFDCGKDDYFHAAPATGSYLATHWNLAHLGSRYLKRPNDASPPTLDPVSCPSLVSYTTPVTCSMRAVDDNAGVVYNVDWGDGTSSVTPTSGTHAPNVTRSATHTFGAGGTMVVRVTATDSGNPPRTSAPRTASVLVSTDNPPPIMDVLGCTAGAEDEPIRCIFSATDGNDVAYTVTWGDGTQERVPPAGYTQANATQERSHVYAAGGAYVVEVSAMDNGSPPSLSAPMQVTVDVTPVNDLPVLATLDCTNPTAPGEPAACTVRATDEEAQGLSYAIAWGDGTTQRVPSAGTVPAGATQLVDRTYAGEGLWNVVVTATDADGATSAARNVTVRVAYDRDGPQITLRQPTQGVYYGCLFVASTVRPNPVFVARGCVEADVTDPAGVAYVDIRHDGRLVGRITEPPYRYQWDVPRATLGAPLTVIALDHYGNTRSVTVRVDSV